MLHPETIFGLGFLAWAGVSLTWSTSPQQGALLLALLAGGYVLGQQMRDLRKLWVCLLVGASLNLVLAFAEFAVWWNGGDFRWYGLAGGSGQMGCVMAVCFAAALGYRQLWFIPIGGIGLVYAGNRGAMAAAGVACLIALWRNYRATAMCLLLLAILAGLVLRDDAGASFVSRLGIWQDTINHLTPLGHGFGSFAAEYAAWPKRTAPALQLAPHAYNDTLELLFDLGLGSVLAWLCVIFAMEGRNRADHLVCWTFLTLSLSFFPLWVIGPAFTLSLGHLARTRGEKPWRAGVSLPSTT